MHAYTYLQHAARELHEFHFKIYFAAFYVRSVLAQPLPLLSRSDVDGGRGGGGGGGGSSNGSSGDAK